MVGTQCYPYVINGFGSLNVVNLSPQGCKHEYTEPRKLCVFARIVTLGVELLSPDLLLLTPKCPLHQRPLGK